MTTSSEPPDDRRMTPQEFRVAREKLGLSVEKLARLLVVHPRTVQRWQNSNQNVPGPVAKAIRLLAEQRGVEAEFMPRQSGRTVRVP